MRLPLLALLAAAALLPESALGQAATAAGFAPHRAVYEVSLLPGSRPERTQIESARGRLVYEFMGSACEGYTTNLRFVTELQLGEGRGQTSDIRSATVENDAATEFRFVTSSFVNNQQRDQADGSARRDGDRIGVELRRPRTQRAELPGAVLFPTQHMVQALDAARNGQRFFSADIYDGSEGGGKVFGTTAVIGRASTGPVEGHPTAAVEALRAAERWPMTISFYDRANGQGEQVPLYELRAEIYGNGVTHALVIDYGTFALQLRMSSIEMLQSTPCN